MSERNVIHNFSHEAMGTRFWIRIADEDRSYAERAAESIFYAIDELDFQVKLFDDGVIEFHYGRMASGSYTRRATGINTVTWLENPAGTQALVINARSVTPGISPHSAFRFSPR